MSTYTMTVCSDGITRSIPLPEGDTVLDALRRAGIREVSAPCGGAGKCRGCTVLIDGAEALACRTRPGRDCTVVLPGIHSAVVETRGAADIPPCGDGLGLAVDIGTTTVAAFLYDLSVGKLLSCASGRNAQHLYGADVISRISHSENKNGLSVLCGAIRRQLDEFIDELCAAADRERSEINRVSIAGNTVMEHIFDGLSPSGIGRAPFTALSLFGDIRPAEGIFRGLSDGCEIYFCPALAGYIGGDITAGLLAAGASEFGELSLFLDIGTNGEMALGSRDGYLCCACAAGPAFEGAEIECGMDSSGGAIDIVSYVNQCIELHVVDGLPAHGICGSGLIDAVAVMTQCGALSYSGRMTPPEEAAPAIASRLRRASDGSLRFYLADEVYVSAADIRKVQLAKAAIRAGIDTLLELEGRSYADIGRVLIAGGFGAGLDLASACRIGLLPAELEKRAMHIGNSAGRGAALALSDEGRRTLSRLAEKCRCYELSGSDIFMTHYIEAMAFEEAEQ